MELQTKIAMLLSVASLLLLVISLFKKKKMQFKLEKQMQEMIHLTIPIEGLMKLLDISFNGQYYSHVKTNSSNDIRVIISELLNWEKPESRPEGLSVTTGQQDGHFIGRPMNRFEMGDNRIEERVEVYRTENVPAMNSLTPLGIRNYLIDNIMTIDFTKKVDSRELVSDLSMYVDGGSPEGLPILRAKLHDLMEKYHNEMMAQGKAEIKSSRPDTNY